MAGRLKRISFKGARVAHAWHAYVCALADLGTGGFLVPFGFQYSVERFADRTLGVSKVVVFGSQLQMLFTDNASPVNKKQFRYVARIDRNRYSEVGQGFRAGEPSDGKGSVELGNETRYQVLGILIKRRRHDLDTARPVFLLNLIQRPGQHLAV